MNSEIQTNHNALKRGGAKFAPLHLAMFLASTLLLTVAGLLLVYNQNLLGVVAMILGIAIRVIDTRL